MLMANSAQRLRHPLPGRYVLPRPGAGREHGDAARDGRRHRGLPASSPRRPATAEQADAADIAQRVRRHARGHPPSDHPRHHVIEPDVDGKPGVITGSLGGWTRVPVTRAAARRAGCRPAARGWCGVTAGEGRPCRERPGRRRRPGRVGRAGRSHSQRTWRTAASAPSSGCAGDGSGAADCGCGAGARAGARAARACRWPRRVRRENGVSGGPAAAQSAASSPFGQYGLQPGVCPAATSAAEASTGGDQRRISRPVPGSSLL
ncbi:hypothetical protein SHL15_8916 [Streptomyces hygroscopicus subsp. limoneus]|nr:hypothetical protein SHL15_8916 [Streptomyces hygroscopicus subsp. limoneus]